MSFQTGDAITYVPDEHRYLMEDKTAALWDLAFWGHPAWTDSNSNTLSTPAVTYLVMYHRMNIAHDKLTIAQIIGGVRGVIPDSKLAKYGDYRYETTFENMYCNTEDRKEERLSMEKREYIDSKQRLCYSKPLDSETGQDISAYHSEKESEFKVKKSVNDWLNKIRNILEGAKRISGVAQPLDSWTEELIKICLRFIYVARINDSVLKIMNSEIPFITDYEQLSKDPISRTELLSLPQPELDEEFMMDLKEIDTLWLKLASPNVKKIWSNQNKMFPGHTEESSENQQSSLITVNFLRRSRQRKNSECPSERIDVPKDVAVGLLGSLLEIIDGTFMESSSEHSFAEPEHKSYFPQAHGDWTKQLFPRRLNLNPLERDTSTAIKRTGVQNATGKAPIPELPSKVDPMVPPEGLMMPLRFYMSVPPPPLASAMRIQAIVRQQQYAIRQPRITMVKVSTSHPTPQQVQGKVPLAPMTCIPSQGLIQTPAPINNWNYKCLQKANTLMQINSQYPRINTGVFYQQIHSKDVSDISKLHSKRDTVGLDNIIARQNEVMNSKWEKGMKENSNLKFPNGSSWMADKPLLQANCESNVRFRLYQNIAKGCNSIQPAVYENCNQQVLSNIYDIKAKPQLQIREAGMTLNINNNGLKFIRLPPMSIQHKLSPRSQTITPFTHKPRFMGGITVNDLKLAQERLFYQKSNPEDNQKNIVDHFVVNKQENCVTCEEKVEKWLETVNYYMKSGSCVNIEELSGPSLLEVSSNCVINGDAETVEWHNNEYETENNPTKISNAFSEKKSKGHARAFAKYKRKDVRQSIVKQLVLFQGSLKLKKGNDLEGMVKLINRYFAELNLKGMRCNLKNKIRNVKFDKSLPENKRKETARKNKCSFVLRTKRENLSLPGRQNYFEIPCSFSKSNINEFKTLCREINEFNAFPSKRMKICSSMSLFLDREPWTYDELKGKISSINYFDMLTDDLFFSVKDPNVKISENPSMNIKIVTGWEHFKIVIKTILQNILATLNKRNARK